MPSLFRTILFLLLPACCAGQGIYKATGVATDFYSSAPIEDIAAQARDGISLWNTSSEEITFRVNIRSFQFEKGKMQEHFNENFMESEKYPSATFKGKLQPPPDLSSEGEFPVILEGILSIHGVEQTRRIEAKLRVMEDTVELTSTFEVAVADHKIRIPKILFRNIAEVISVHVFAEYSKLEP